MADASEFYRELALQEATRIESSILRNINSRTITMQEVAEDTLIIAKVFERYLRREDTDGS